MLVSKKLDSDFDLLGCKFSDFANTIYGFFIMEGRKVFIDKLIVVANISVIF